MILKILPYLTFYYEYSIGLNILKYRFTFYDTQCLNPINIILSLFEVTGNISNLFLTLGGSSAAGEPPAPNKLPKSGSLPPFFTSISGVGITIFREVLGSINCEGFVFGIRFGFSLFSFLNVLRSGLFSLLTFSKEFSLLALLNLFLSRSLDYLSLSDSTGLLHIVSYILK